MELNEQLEWFKRGFPNLQLAECATVGNGIKRLSKEEEERFISLYESSEMIVEKFVPASGAATRMFQGLLEFKQSNEQSEKTKEFFERITELPFNVSGSPDHILKELFDFRRLDKLPKGLLPFHKTSTGSRTPAEEHLVEAIGYARKNGPIRIHFTVSPQHLTLFVHFLSKSQESFQEKFDLTFSTQNAETDTVAVSQDNEPVRLPSGDYLIRPAGHGALLENLNTREADLIFIKNIDNVVPDRLKPETVKHKKILAGILLDFQKQVFLLLEQAEKGDYSLSAAKSLLEKCGIRNVNDEQVIEKLNRPIRVCGMVKNSGEPGGGPFWVRKGNEESLQIVEGAQINKLNAEQRNVFNQSTHFNPVDIVCGIKDYRANKFDLMKYRDPETGFITEKSHDGRPIKALELPGLWNGGMAYWNTIFVEVPLITFNPVKTVNDLLRQEHQP